MFKIAQFTFNPFGENTYAVWDDSLKAAIIDPGNSTATEDKALTDFIDSHSLSVELVLLTHGHFDHVAGVNLVKERYGARLAMHKADDYLLEAAPEQGKRYRLNINPMKVDCDLSEQMNIGFGNSVLDIIPTPGHSRGGVSFYSPEQKVLFTGDTLFRESIGRTDLEGGDYDQIMDSILYKLLPLGEDVQFFAGHGPESTISHETLYNPFVTEVIRGGFNIIDNID